MAKTWVIVLTSGALWTGCLFGLSMRRSEPTGEPNVNDMDAQHASSTPAKQPEPTTTQGGQLLEGPGPSGGGPGPSVMMPAEGPSTVAQIAFVGPDGMIVQWDIDQPGAFDSEPLVIPGRMNFARGGIYRLKLTNIPGHDGTELYPTIEVGPATPRTEVYAAHAYTPVQFTDEDFEQVLKGNLVTKVIYLPDPEFQGLALAGVETLVSTRLDPSIDPIVEADRRGTILAVVRMGRSAGE